MILVAENFLGDMFSWKGGGGGTGEVGMGMEGVAEGLSERNYALMGLCPGM